MPMCIPDLQRYLTGNNVFKLNYFRAAFTQFKNKFPYFFIFHIGECLNKPAHSCETNASCTNSTGCIKKVDNFEMSRKLAMRDEPISLNQKIANFLLMYRNAPHSTTNETPAKMFLGRNFRSVST